MIVLFLLPVALWPASALQQHQHGGATAARDGQFNPWVVSRPQGDGFYITYVQRTGSSSDVMFQLADSAGKLTPPVRVNDRPGDAAVRNENPPKVAVGPKGEIYVVWANEREKWKGNIRFARSTDEGRSFSPALTLNSDGSGRPAGHAFQSMVVDASSRIHVAWIDERNKTAKNRGAEIWICTSTDGGQTFRPDRKVLSDVCECCRTTFAADSDGNLFIAYRTVPAEGPMYRDIVVARSRDGGETFRPSVVSHDGWELNGCPVAGPAIAIGDQDQLSVFWFTQGKGTARLLSATSADHGISFSSPRPPGAEPRSAKHAHAVAGGDRTLLVAWDEMGSTSVVKWGLLDPVRNSVQLMESHSDASYPVVAANQSAWAMVAVSSGSPELVRRFEPRRR